MSKDDDFRNLVGDDVAPLKIEARELLRKQTQDSETLVHRRGVAAQVDVHTADPLGGEPVELMQAMALLEFKRPGVQNGVYRKFRLGKYAIDARLDLHRLTVDSARQAVFQFVVDCDNNDVRTALITHGKSEGRATPALLKSYVAHWLPQLEEVLAFHTAQKQHGGYGATYVLLKKSEKKKQKNRELHR